MSSRRKFCQCNNQSRSPPMSTVTRLSRATRTSSILSRRSKYNNKNKSRRTMWKKAQKRPSWLQKKKTLEAKMGKFLILLLTLPTSPN